MPEARHLDIASITQGRGIYEMGYDHFERVPNDVQEKVVAEYAKHRKEEEKE